MRIFHNSQNNYFVVHLQTVAFIKHISGRHDPCNFERPLHFYLITKIEVSNEYFGIQAYLVLCLYVTNVNFSVEINGYYMPRWFSINQSKYVASKA